MLVRLVRVLGWVAVALGVAGVGLAILHGDVWRGSVLVAVLLLLERFLEIEEERT